MARASEAIAPRCRQIGDETVVDHWSASFAGRVPHGCQQQLASTAAACFYRAAADEGYPLAQTNLDVMHESGEGGSDETTGRLRAFACWRRTRASLQGRRASAPSS